MKVKIRIDTLTDFNKFFSIVSQAKEEVYITDGNGLRVSGKSALGARYAMEFDNIWCESDEDLTTKLLEFIV